MLWSSAHLNIPASHNPYTPEKKRNLLNKINRLTNDDQSSHCSQEHTIYAIPTALFSGKTWRRGTESSEI